MLLAVLGAAIAGDAVALQRRRPALLVGIGATVLGPLAAVLAIAALWERSVPGEPIAVCCPDRRRPRPEPPADRVGPSRLTSGCAGLAALLTTARTLGRFDVGYVLALGMLIVATVGTLILILILIALVMCLMRSAGATG